MRQVLEYPDRGTEMIQRHTPGFRRESLQGERGMTIKKKMGRRAGRGLALSGNKAIAHGIKIEERLGNYTIRVRTERPHRIGLYEYHELVSPAPEIFFRAISPKIVILPSNTPASHILLQLHQKNRKPRLNVLYRLYPINHA